MSTFDPSQYGALVARWIDTDRNRELGPGTPIPAVRGELSQVTVAQVAGERELRDPQLARCTLAGIWLLYDLLDESHQVSQQVKGPEGSFWHGIMHRREGDYSNAKYWFRQAGTLPILTPLGTAVEQLGAEHHAEPLAAELVRGGVFAPAAFVDACQSSVSGGGSAEAFCRAVQQLEWELLFDSCYQRAFAAG
jgi:hypothetical protein